MIKIKTQTVNAVLGEWELIHKIYWLRTDGIKVKNIHHGFILDFNNAAGFLIENGAPRFFGSNFEFLIKEWYSFNTQLSSNVEKNKQIFDNFLSFFTL